MSQPISFFGETYNDNTRKSDGKPESASFRFPVPDITPSTLAATSSAILDLSVAIEAVVIGVLAKRRVIASEAIISASRASSTAAQRENKWLCRYTDNSTHEEFRGSIPTADLTLLPDGSEFLDLTADPGLALKTAFEAIVKSPSDVSHAVTLQSVQFVGRNL